MPLLLLHSRRLRRPSLLLRRCIALQNARRPSRQPCANASTTLPQCLRCHRYSTGTGSARHDVQVACRSNGCVHLSILRRQRDDALPSPILLFLPPGPILSETPPEHQDQLLRQLAHASNATVVSVNYRAGDHHRYPAPVHDVLTAYDWVLANLASQPQHCSPRKPHLARIGVCGELIGGSLATMLALTECRMGTHRIAAAAVNNPVVDWIFPSDLHQEAESENASDDLDVSTVSTDDDGRIALQNKLKKNPDAHISSWDKYGGNPALPLSAVVHARASLFPNADAYFDRFACPIHFFRTPGIGYVVPTKTEDDLASEVPRELDTTENPEPVLETLKPIIEKRRRSHRLYPPTGMGLRLPVMSISVGEESVLRDQSEELVRLIKRSVIRDTRNEGEAERRAGLTLRPGAGLWSGHSRASNWHEEIGAIGEWFGRVLA